MTIPITMTEKLSGKNTCEVYDKMYRSLTYFNHHGYRQLLLIKV